MFSYHWRIVLFASLAFDVLQMRAEDEASTIPIPEYEVAPDENESSTTASCDHSSEETNKKKKRPGSLLENSFKKISDVQENMLSNLEGMRILLGRQTELLEQLVESNTEMLKLHEKTNGPASPAANANMTKLHKNLHATNHELMGIRPKVDPSRPVIVTLVVNLYQIIEMNDAEEYLKAYIHVNMTYFNEYLGWNPNEFGNITTTELNAAEDMWMPDIFAYNGVDMKNENQYFTPIPRITTNYNAEDNRQLQTVATVEYSYPRIVKFLCSFDTFYFPFDYQICTLVFRSWRHPTQEIHIVPGVIENILIEDNDEWLIENVTQTSKIMRATNSSDRFSIYQEEILLKRKPLYHIVNLFVPSIIITQVAFFGFFSPSSSDGDRTEKVNLGMGTLLAMSVLLLTVCGMTPVNSSHIPLTGIFFLANMILISLGVMTTTIIMMVHQRGKRMKQVPKWIQTVLFFRVAPLIGLKIPNKIRNSRRRGSKKFRMPDALEKTSNKCSSETLLLEGIPAIKQLKEHIDSIINGRQRELAEIEYIFLAKILDAMMLLAFSTFLYTATGCVFYVGLTQRPPDITDRQPMYRNAKIYKDVRSRFEEEFLELLNATDSSYVDCDYAIKILGRNPLNLIPHCQKDGKNRTKMEPAYLDIMYQYYLAGRESVTTLYDTWDVNFDLEVSRDEFSSACPDTILAHIIDSRMLERHLTNASLHEYAIDQLNTNLTQEQCTELFNVTDINRDSRIKLVELLYNNYFLERVLDLSSIYREAMLSDGSIIEIDEEHYIQYLYGQPSGATDPVTEY